MPGLDGGQAKQLYKCKAVNCSVTPRGCDLKKHYMIHTDWQLVSEMKATLSEANVERLREKADPHTDFIFSKGFSKERMPSWSTHVMVRKTSEADEGGSGQQSVLTSFFKVSSTSQFATEYKV